MKSLLLSATTLLCLLAGGLRGDDLPLAEALAQTGVQGAWMSNGRDLLQLAVRNASPNAVRLVVPAGFLLASASGNKLMVLRSAELRVPAGEEAKLVMPVVALSPKRGPKPQTFEMTRAAEPRLAALLKYLADKPDAPHLTSQLVALALLEDVTFTQWFSFLTLPPEAQVTPAQVAQAIDALGILRLLEPGKTFALGTDAELKARALRNPWCRAKAMQLYGITLPASDGAVPPDIGQLLHTTPDNCPICRQRAEMQTSPNGL